MDVKYFYLNNMMYRSDYILIQISIISQGLLDKYNLKGKAHNVYIFAQVSNEMYGLTQSGRISHDDLVKNLDPY